MGDMTMVLESEERDWRVSYNGRNYDLNKILILSRDIEPVIVQMKYLEWNVSPNLKSAVINAANVKLPVVAVSEFKIFHVIDGRHRLAKMYYEKQKEVNVVIVPMMIMELCML